MWARINPAWHRDVRTKRLDRRLGERTGLYYLMALWEWAMDQASEVVDLELLEEQVEWDGDEGVLVDALVASGFINDDGELDEWYTEAAQPWLDYQNKRATTKEKNRLRAKKHRDKNRRERNAKNAARNAKTSVTSRSETPKREKTVTPHERDVTPKTRDVTDEKRDVTPQAEHTSRQNERDVRPIRYIDREKSTGDAPAPRPAHVYEPNLSTGSEPQLTPIGGGEQGSPELNDAREAVDAFLQEYGKRTNAQPMASGMYNKGFFGVDGEIGVKQHLDGLVERYSRVLVVGLPAFWKYWDHEQSGNPRPRKYPRNTLEEVERYLMRRGLPSPIVRHMAAQQAKDN